jgi:hypothetical protein
MKSFVSKPQQLLTAPMKMEITQRSETSEHKIQTPGSHQHKEYKYKEAGDNYMIRCFIIFIFKILLV